MGGFPDADTPEKLLNRFTDFYVADIDDDPEPDAGIYYTNWGGSKKASALVHDGSAKAKDKLKTMMADFLSRPGAWIEVSGAPTNILIKKMGFPSVDSEELVKKLLSKTPDNIFWHGKHPNGLSYGNGWYTRKIGGQMQTKIIVGNPPSK